MNALDHALQPLAGLLEVSVHPGASTDAAPADTQVQVDLIGNDHPGIVRDVSGVLARHGVSIDHRSLAEQNVRRQPTQHLGPQPSAQ